MFKNLKKILSILCVLVMTATVFSAAATNVLADENKEEKTIESLNPDVATNEYVHIVWQENLTGNYEIYYANNLTGAYKTELNTAVQKVQSLIENITDKKLKSELEKALKELNKALANATANDYQHSFKHLQHAVEGLDKKDLNYGEIITALVNSVRDITKVNILYREFLNISQDYTTKAWENFYKGLGKVNEEKYDKAVNEFRKAFKEAYKIDDDCEDEECSEKSNAGIDFGKTVRISYTDYDSTNPQISLNVEIHVGWIEKLLGGDHVYYARSTTGKVWWYFDATAQANTYLCYVGIDPSTVSIENTLNIVRTMERIWIVDKCHYFYAPIARDGFTIEDMRVFAPLNDPYLELYADRYEPILIGDRKLYVICGPGPVPIPPPKSPDLATVDIQTELSMQAEENITLYATIANQADCDITGVTVRFLYIAEDTVTLINEITDIVFLANVTQQIVTQWKPIIGMYDIKVVVDPEELLSDMNRDNNAVPKYVEWKSIMPEALYSSISQEARYIVSGTVKDIYSVTDPAGIIYSYGNVTVDDVIKGSLSIGQVVTIRYTGGTVGNVSMRVFSMYQITPDSFLSISEPDFYKGEKVTLCLKDLVGVFDVLGGYIRVIGGAIQPLQATEYGYIYAGYRWSSMPVRYYINQDGTADTTNEFTAVQNAFQTWEDDVGSFIDFEYGGTTTRTAPSKDGVNVVDWVPTIARNIPARCTVWYSGGNIIEADMYFNDSYNWGTGGETNRLDVQNVGTHEAGHFLSLNDMYGTEDSEQTMYGYVSIGETKKRSLEWGDLAGVRRIYPHTHKKDGWVGHESQGGDIAFWDINGNGIQDVVMVWVDNPTGENTIRWQIGWDVSSANGRASSWSTIKTKPGWVGHETQGVGIVFAYIDAGTTPDMVLTWVDIPSGENKISYHIGWNVNTAGDPSSWSSVKTKPGWVGHETQGVAITFAYIDAGTAPDMVLTWVDNPPGENTIRYQIGWNVNTAGDPSSWSSVKTKSGWVGHGTQDVGVTILDLDLNGKNDIVLMWVDIPSGENKIVYHIGWDLTTAGDASSTRGWSRIFTVGGWIGHETQGGGLSFAHIDGNGRPDLGIMWIDNPGGENSVNYRYV